MMKNGKWAALLVGAAVLVGSAGARANSAAHFVTQYPGTSCNAFGNTSVGGNGGVEIVNWSQTSSVLVDCPVPVDPVWSSSVDYAQLSYRGSMTCALTAQRRNGSGWYFRPDGTTFNAGYNEYYWNARAFDQFAAESFECVLSPWATLNSYRVSAIQGWD